MQTFSILFNIKEISGCPFNEQISSLLLDEFHSEIRANGMLAKHLLLNIKNPLCLAKRVFSLLIAQKIKDQVLCKKELLSQILLFDNMPLKNWDERVFVKSLRLLVDEDAKAQLDFLKSVNVHANMQQQSTFVLHAILLAKLMNSEGLLDFALGLADNFLIKAEHTCFDNLFVCSESTISDGNGFIQGYLICLFLSKTRPSICQEKLIFYFQSKLSADGGQTRFLLLDSLIERYFHTFQETSNFEKKSHPKLDFIEASVLKNESGALASFSFKTLYAPCIGFSNTQSQNEKLLYFDPLFSEISLQSQNRISLIASLNDEYASYCSLDIKNEDEKLQIRALFEGDLEFRFCIFVRCDSLEINKDKFFQKGGLEQFLGTIKQLVFVNSDCKTQLATNFLGEVKINPLAGGLYFWTADFMLSFTLNSTHNNLLLNFSDKY